MSVEYISVLVDNDSTVNGHGQSVKVSETISKWASDLASFQKHLESKTFPQPYSLVVPDFWHICYGRAKCLPKAEADELWESTSEALKAAKPFVDCTELVVRPHPGRRLHLKNPASPG
jgi:hypothetical protein